MTIPHPPSPAEIHAAQVRHAAMSLATERLTHLARFSAHYLTMNDRRFWGTQEGWLRAEAKALAANDDNDLDEQREALLDLADSLAALARPIVVTSRGSGASLAGTETGE